MPRLIIATVFGVVVFIMMYTDMTLIRPEEVEAWKLIFNLGWSIIAAVTWYWILWLFR